MKKILILLSILAGSVITQPPGLFAQTSGTPITLDAKTQKKLDKAKVDLAKDQQKLTKSQDNYSKSLAKFEKDKSNGKLSPDDIVKGKKSLEKANNDIIKLRKAIADNQAFVDKYIMPALPKM